MVVDEMNYCSKVVGVIEVAKRDIVVTAQNYSITYGENIPEFEYKVENAISSDNLVFEFVDYEYSNQVGEYSINILEKTFDNYNVKYINGNLVISQKTLQVYAPVDIFKYYGEQDPEFVVSYDKNDVEFDDVLTFTIIRESGETVGDYQISNITLDNQNYKLNVISSTFKILKKKIAIKAISYSKILLTPAKKVGIVSGRYFFKLPLYIIVVTVVPPSFIIFTNLYEMQDCII